METKEGRPIFLKVFSIVLVVILLNFIYLVYRSGTISHLTTGFSISDISNITTGFSIKESVVDSYSSLSVYSKVFMISLWFFLFFFLTFAVFRDVTLGKKKNEEIDIHIKRNSNENKTDLDLLYDIIKNNKELPISAISKSFGIKKEAALEWCKILESGDLVSISYPGFSESIVRINEKEIENIAPKKSNILNDNIKKEIEGPPLKKIEEKLGNNDIDDVKEKINIDSDNTDALKENIKDEIDEPKIIKIEDNMPKKKEVQGDERREIPGYKKLGNNDIDDVEEKINIDSDDTDALKENIKDEIDEPRIIKIEDNMPKKKEVQGDERREIPWYKKLGKKKEVEYKMPKGIQDYQDLWK